VISVSHLTDVLVSAVPHQYARAVLKRAPSPSTLATGLLINAFDPSDLDDSGEQRSDINTPQTKKAAGGCRDPFAIFHERIRCQAADDARRRFEHSADQRDAPARTSGRGASDSHAQVVDRPRSLA
jgi:hypothetical protein